MTLANVTISSGNVTITNVTVTTANATTVNTTTLIATTANVTTGNVTNLVSGNVSLTGGAINGTTLGATTAASANVTTLTTSSTVTLSGGTANGVAYLDGSKVLTTGSALTFDGSKLTVKGGNAGQFVLDNANEQYIQQLFQRNATANTGADFLLDGSGNTFNFRTLAAGMPFVWAVSATAGTPIEGMRLTSTGLEVKQSQLIGYSSYAGIGTNGLAVAGNVGIGTSSPATRLHVAAAGSAIVLTQSTVNNSGAFYRSSGLNGSGTALVFEQGVNITANGYEIYDRQNSQSVDVYLPGASGYRALYTNGTERMRLDSSGNLGLGVTPSAWAGNGNIQGQNSFVWSAYDASLGANYYYDGAYRYIDSTRGVSKYEPFNGAHKWYTAPSGTAGNAISFTQAMTLDASGNLGVGQTNPSAWLVNGIGVGSGASDWGATIYTGTSSSGYLCFADGTSSTDRYRGYLQYSHATDAMVFATEATERARITSVGHFVVARGTGGDTTVGATLYDSGTITCARSASTNGDLNLYVYSTGAAAARFYVGMGGTVYATSTTITAISDQRLKENIQDIDVGLDAIMALKPRKFDWKAGKGKDKKGDRGWIAQEFEQVFPDMVDTWADPAPEGEEPYKAVNADLIPVLVKALQELKAEFDAYKATHP
jgi:uncharacterized cupredoxin-like copper-binding protein